MANLLKRRLLLHRSKNLGFSLVEVLVVAALITLITGFVVVTQQNFNRSIVINNIGLDIAHTIRQAQVYSLSVKRSGIGFVNPYGLYFKRDVGDTYLDSFELFQDTNGNGLYDATESIEQYTLQGRYTISEIMVDSAGASPQCFFNAGCAGGQISEAYIFFTRPNPDADIRVGNDIVTEYPDIILTLNAPDSTSQINIVTNSIGSIWTN